MVDRHLEHPSSAPIPDQPSPQGESNSSGSSGPLFTMYLQFSEEEDNKMAERWQKDAEGMIIFSGLFSVVVAVLVAVSVQDLRPNSQDASAFYLEKMYQLQADPNVSRLSIPPAVAKLPAFSPPKYAIWVNSLWFLSLSMSLTCTMLATSLQQWARRYLRVTQLPRCSPHERARVRAFFANGADKLHVTRAAEALPILIHLSLFIFFIGLVIYLFNMDHTVFDTVVCWVASLSVVYVCITLMPIFRHDTPYFSPLSPSVWFLFSSLLRVILRVIFILIMPFGDNVLEAYCSRVDKLLVRFMEGVGGAVEEVASGRPAEIDGRVIGWTIDALGEDDALERFFEAIPGFYQSDVGKGIRECLPEGVRRKVLNRLNRFLDRTLSSNSVSELVKVHRLAVCLYAASEVDPDLGVGNMFGQIINGNWHGLPHSIEIGHFLTSWDKANSGSFNTEIQGIIACIVANVQERNDRWVSLAMDNLGISEGVLQDYLAHGDSLKLANMIHLIHQLLRLNLEPHRSLELLGEFDIRGTLPELQHEFCALWNEIALRAQNSGPYSDPIRFLRVIRHHYIALHRGTDAAPTVFSDSTPHNADVLFDPPSYPLCNIPGHLPDPTPRVRELSALRQVSLN
ncbi:hypothetical protein BJV74DRAFT_454490 [Russula compacta]|nr:hypothetical protein BJV74DRAFT_454490 [Russula compacta]